MLPTAVGQNQPLLLGAFVYFEKKEILRQCGTLSDQKKIFTITYHAPGYDLFLDAAVTFG